MVQTVICCGPGRFAPGIKEASPQLYYKIHEFRMVNIIGAKKGQEAIAISAKKQQAAIELVPLVRPSPERISKPFLFGRVYINGEKKQIKLEDTPYRKRKVL
jgi:hypothetical protein